MVMFLNILGLSVASSMGTRWLVKKKNFSPIRASSLLTLILVSFLTLLKLDQSSVLSAVILGGTFVGMNDSERISSRNLLSVSLLFSLIFYYILPFNKGLGGALGLAAFLSSLITYLFRNKILTRILR